MKKNPAFRLRVMQSKYFQPSGHESLATIIHDFGDPFKLSITYAHMKRHQPNDLIAAKKRFDALEVVNPHSSGPMPLAHIPPEVIEGQVLSQGDHEATLSEFIQKGREKLQRGEMAISATTLLTAIKIRSEIDKSTKDRRLDMVKSFFAGGEKKDA
jgi:hypothetical protein